MHETPNSTIPSRRADDDGSNVGEKFLVELQRAVDHWFSVNRDALLLALVAIFAASIGRCMRKAFEDWNERLGTNYRPSNSLKRQANEQAKTLADSLGDGFKRTLLETLVRLANQLFQRGFSLSEVRRQVRETLKGELVDREILESFGADHEVETCQIGRELANDGLGATRKRWRTVGDGRVDAICRDNEAVGFIPFGASFPSGHTRPPAHPGCRCSVQYEGVTAKSAYWEANS